MLRLEHANSMYIEVFLSECYKCEGNERVNGKQRMSRKVKTRSMSENLDEKRRENQGAKALISVGNENRRV